MKNMTGVDNITNNNSTGTLTLTNIASVADITAKANTAVIIGSINDTENCDICTITATATNTNDVDIAGKIAIMKGAAATSFDTAGEVAAEIGASTGANVSWLIAADKKAVVITGASSSTTAYV